MRWALAIALVSAAGCGGDGSSSSKDLSTVDLSGAVECPGAVAGAVACDPNGSDVCYPDSAHYCFCSSGQWSCCGDVVPTCPATPGAAGDFCCPGEPNGPGSTELDCPYGCSGGQRTVCSCGDDFVWRCASEACSDAGP